MIVIQKAQLQTFVTWRLVNAVVCRVSAARTAIVAIMVTGTSVLPDAKSVLAIISEAEEGETIQYTIYMIEYNK